MELALPDRAYVVTGGSGGLGYATAQQLIAEGARVVISGLTPSATARAAESLGGGDRATRRIRLRQTEQVPPAADQERKNSHDRTLAALHPAARYDTNITRVLGVTAHADDAFSHVWLDDDHIDDTASPPRVICCMAKPRTTAAVDHSRPRCDHRANTGRARLRRITSLARCQEPPWLPDAHAGEHETPRCRAHSLPAS
jgi:nucleoside-diphosphate-sugar epimerase